MRSYRTDTSVIVLKRLAFLNALAVALVMGGGGMATPPAHAAQKPFKLRLKLHKGDQFTYSMAISGKATMNLPGQPMPPFQLSGNMRVRRTVVEANSDGGYTLEERPLGGVMTVVTQGITRKQPIPAGESQFSTVNALGRYTFSSAQKAMLKQAGSKMGMDPSELIAPFTSLQAFPQETVAPGSKWQRQAGFKLPPNISFNIVLNNKLTRIVPISNVPTAEVVSAIRVPIKFAMDQKGTSVKINGNFGGDGKTHYSLATGMPMKMGGAIGGNLAFAASGANAGFSAMGAQSGSVRFNMQYQMRMVSAKRGVDTSAIASRMGQPGFGNGISRRGTGGFSAGPGGVGGASGAGASVPPIVVPPPPLAELKIETQKGVVSGEVPVHAVINETENKPVGYVAFVVNGERPYISNAAPYRFSWDTTELPSGVYQIGIEVYGASGELLYKSPARKVRVKSTPSSPRPQGVPKGEQAA